MFLYILQNKPLLLPLKKFPLNGFIDYRSSDKHKVISKWVKSSLKWHFFQFHSEIFCDQWIIAESINHLMPYFLSRCGLKQYQKNFVQPWNVLLSWIAMKANLRNKSWKQKSARLSPPMNACRSRRIVNMSHWQDASTLYN